MKRGYPLSAEALLYSVVLKKKAGIYGVENVLADIGEAEYPAFARRAEEELVACGAGELDFGDGMSLTEEFDALMDLCTDCAGVVAVDVKGEKGLRHMTFYLGAEQVPVLVRAEQGYMLYPQSDAGQMLEEFLALPEDRFDFPPCRLDSGKAAGTKASDLAAQGLGSEEAAFLAQALNGGHSFCQVSRIEGFEKNELLPFVYSDQGCAEISVEYDSDKEYLVFAAVGREELLGRIEKMLTEEMVTSFDQKEYDGIEYLPEEEAAMERDEELAGNDEEPEEGGE